MQGNFAGTSTGQRMTRSMANATQDDTSRALGLHFADEEETSNPRHSTSSSGTRPPCPSRTRHARASCSNTQDKVYPGLRRDMHQLTHQLSEMRVEQQAVCGDVAQNHQLIMAMQREQTHNWRAFWTYHGMDPLHPPQP